MARKFVSSKTCHTSKVFNGCSKEELASQVWWFVRIQSAGVVAFLQNPGPEFGDLWQTHECVSFNLIFQQFEKHNLKYVNIDRPVVLHQVQPSSASQSLHEWLSCIHGLLALAIAIHSTVNIMCIVATIGLLVGIYS